MVIKANNIHLKDKATLLLITTKVLLHHLMMARLRSLPMAENSIKPTHHKATARTAAIHHIRTSSLPTLVTTSSNSPSLVNLATLVLAHTQTPMVQDLKAPKVNVGLARQCSEERPVRFLDTKSVLAMVCSALLEVPSLQTRSEGIRRTSMTSTTMEWLMVMIILRITVAATIIVAIIARMVVVAHMVAAPLVV